jgi:hypothetical protein
MLPSTRARAGLAVGDRRARHVVPDTEEKVAEVCRAAVRAWEVALVGQREPVLDPNARLEVIGRRDADPRGPRPRDRRPELPTSHGSRGFDDKPFKERGLDRVIALAHARPDR